MRNYFPLIAGIATLASVSSLGVGLIDALVGKREINVITVTDMTPAGRLQTAATPQAPVYYVAVSSGFKNLGGVEAGDKKLSSVIGDHLSAGAPPCPVVKVISQNGPELKQARERESETHWDL